MAQFLWITQCLLREIQPKHRPHGKSSTREIPIINKRITFSRLGRYVRSHMSYTRLCAERQI